MKTTSSVARQQARLAANRTTRTPVPDIPVQGNCAACGLFRVLDEAGGLCHNCQYGYETGTPGQPKPTRRLIGEWMYLGYCRACIRAGRSTPAVTIADGSSACDEHAR